MIFKKRRKERKKRKEKEGRKWPQPRMRVDLPPGGFLRLPAAPPDGSEGCGFSWSSCSTSSGNSAQGCIMGYGGVSSLRSRIDPRPLNALHSGRPRCFSEFGQPGSKTRVNRILEFKFFIHYRKSYRLNLNQTH